MNIRIYRIHAGKYRRYHGESILKRLFDVKTNVLNIRDMFRFVIGMAQAYSLVKRIRPNVAFLKGGFVVVPVGKACAKLKIPYITHDSDPLPGLANRLISKNAYVHAVATEGVKAYPPDSIRVTGIPLSDHYISLRNGDRGEARSRLGLPKEAFIVFIFAGTQGARTIDEAMNTYAAALFGSIKNLYIVHVFGRLNQDAMMTCYETLSDENKKNIMKRDFVSNAYDYITAADLIIGRAGATTLAEIAMIGRAAIIIPAGHLTSGHQLENAAMYAHNGGIEIIEESSLDESLVSTITVLAGNEGKRNAMEAKIAELAQPDAAGKIAELLYEAAKK